MVHERLSTLRILPSTNHANRPEDRASVSIYRPFFLSGIFTVLTVGCLLGAIALFGISVRQSYIASAWTPYVLAHANSQLFGWVGFFIMGFALQQHAPPEKKAATFHRLAYWSLGLMGAGIALRFVAEPMAKVDRSFWVPVGIAACALQLVAVLLFFYNSQANRFRTGERLKWQSLFVFASLFWLFVVAAAEPFFFALTHQVSSDDSIMFVAKWFPPYREAQFLGFAAMMIFGVALVKMHSCFGFREADSRTGLLGFGLWTTGLVSRIFGWIQYFNNGMQPGQDSFYRTSSLLLALGAVMIVVSLGLAEKPTDKLRPQKFVRAAFAWLVVAGLMMVLEPLHLRSINAPFSHAYTGAIRHAVTVGFISQMILGVGMHVVARMNGLADARLASLWSVFILLNAGNTARVALEFATDYTPKAFAYMGATGFVELTALAIWAYHVARPLLVKNYRAKLFTC